MNTEVTAGFDSARLARLRDALNHDVQAERCDGVSMALVRRGQTVFTHKAGFANRAASQALGDDDVFVAFSITKQFVHVLALDRIERGQLALSTRVADVIPEFGCRGKENITLAHLLTHTSGLPLKLPPMPDPMQLMNLDALVAATCACMPEFVPGERVYYSGIVGVAIIGEMLRRTEGSGRRLRDLMNEDLFVPLGMKDTALGLRPDLAPRLVPVVARDRRPGVSMAEEYEMFGAMVTAEAEIPGLGAVSTRADLLRFTRMLAEGGVLDGKRILSPAMLDLATRNHTGQKPNEMLAYTVASRGWAPFPASLGLGFFLRGEGLHPHPFGSLASPRTFGGLGAGSSMFWVDPARELSCVFLSAGIVTDESRNIDRLQRLSDLALASLVE